MNREDVATAFIFVMGFCYLFFTIRSCHIEDKTIELEMRKYPLKIERQSEVKTTIDTRPGNE